VGDQVTGGIERDEQANDSIVTLEQIRAVADQVHQIGKANLGVYLAASHAFEIGGERIPQSLVQGQHGELDFGGAAGRAVLSQCVQEGLTGLPHPCLSPFSVYVVLRCRNRSRSGEERWL
jgi:hypothetical protein